VRPRAKVTIEVVYKKSIGTKMNDLDLCLEVVSAVMSSVVLVEVVMSTIVIHSALNISETVGDRGLVTNDHQ